MGRIAVEKGRQDKPNGRDLLKEVRDVLYDLPAWRLGSTGAVTCAGERPWRRQTALFPATSTFRRLSS